ncbi:MAG: hypothetical protein K2X99_07800 [Gemmatimonadaceae bacterium]|nr:hypothetical protein [Gemmatimonadaceae bacterium]
MLLISTDPGIAEAIRRAGFRIRLCDWEGLTIAIETRPSRQTLLVLDLRQSYLPRRETFDHLCRRAGLPPLVAIVSPSEGSLTAARQMHAANFLLESEISDLEALRRVLGPLSQDTDVEEAVQTAHRHLLRLLPSGARRFAKRHLFGPMPPRSVKEVGARARQSRSVLFHEWCRARGGTSLSLTTVVRVQLFLVAQAMHERIGCWNKIADALGISRHTLRRLRRVFGRKPFVRVTPDL